MPQGPRIQLDVGEQEEGVYVAMSSFLKYGRVQKKPRRTKDTHLKHTRRSPSLCGVLGKLAKLVPELKGPDGLERVAFLLAGGLEEG